MEHGSVFDHLAGLQTRACTLHLNVVCMLAGLPRICHEQMSPQVGHEQVSPRIGHEQVCAAQQLRMLC